LEDEKLFSAQLKINQESFSTSSLFAPMLDSVTQEQKKKEKEKEKETIFHACRSQDVKCIISSQYSRVCVLMDGKFMR
jgi:hypothetical protein